MHKFYMGGFSIPISLTQVKTEKKLLKQKHFKLYSYFFQKKYSKN
jgi:hypothetical protein